MHPGEMSLVLESADYQLVAGHELEPNPALQQLIIQMQAIAAGKE